MLQYTIDHSGGIVVFAFQFHKLSYNNHSFTVTQQTRHIDLMLVQCWASVVDGGPTLAQHWIDVSCLLGRPSFLNTLKEVIKISLSLLKTSLGVRTPTADCSQRDVWVEHGPEPNFHYLNNNQICLLAKHSAQFSWVVFSITHGVTSCQPIAYLSVGFRITW